MKIFHIVHHYFKVVDNIVALQLQAPALAINWLMQQWNLIAQMYLDNNLHAIFVFLLGKNNYPGIPPPSYFTESPPDYNTVVCDNRSPHVLLADLQPHQRPFSVSGALL